LDRTAADEMKEINLERHNRLWNFLWVMHVGIQDRSFCKCRGPCTQSQGSQVCGQSSDIKPEPSEE
jgi:hypothetical protein